MIGFQEILVILGANSPALALWIAVIVFAAIMLRRGGGRAERFLITGASIKLAANLLNIPAVFIVPWFIDKGYGMDATASIASGYSIFFSVVSMVGIICLIYAFWVKFKEMNYNREVALSQD